MFNQVVAKQMGLDTRMNTSLWKDRAVVELTAAVIYSFQVFNSLSYIVIYIIFFLLLLNAEAECHSRRPPHGRRIVHDVSSIFVQDYSE